MSTLAQLILLIGIIYLVNRVAVPTMFSKLIGFHEKYSRSCLLGKIKQNLYSDLDFFYCVAGALIAYGILKGE